MWDSGFLVLQAITCAVYSLTYSFLLCFTNGDNEYKLRFLQGCGLYVSIRLLLLGVSKCCGCGRCVLQSLQRV